MPSFILEVVSAIETFVRGGIFFWKSSTLYSEICSDEYVLIKDLNTLK